MRYRSKFNNTAFRWCVIFFLSIFLLWNIYISIAGNSKIAIVSILIQATVLIMVLTKSRYAKLSLITYGLIFFIIGSGLQLVGRLIQDIGYDFENFDLAFYLKNITIIAIGAFIVVMAKKTVITENR